MNFTSRDRLPFILNEHGLLGLGVEVGVQTGRHARHIRSHWNGTSLILVDPWRPYYGVLDTQDMHDSYLAECVTGMKILAEQGRKSGILRMTSMEAAAIFHTILPAFPDGIFDFVYLDDDHSYEGVRDGIDMWFPLVKKGGILAGHDYVVDGWHKNGEPYTAHATMEEAGGNSGHCGPFYVRQAVDEAFHTGGRFATKTGELCITDPKTDGGWQSWLVFKRRT